MMRLYRAWSVIDEYLGQDQVKFNWFVVGRPTPLYPYEELIDYYDETRDEVCYDQMWVNEFFSKKEIEELRGYLLNSHGIEIQAEEVVLPVRPGGLSYGLLLISGQSNFYSLADEEGYNLSVSILGQYDLEKNESINLLSYEELQNGAKFLEELFAKLKIAILDKKELNMLLNQIYKETGLCVQHNKKKSKIMTGMKLNN